MVWVITQSNKQIVDVAVSIYEISANKWKSKERIIKSPFYNVLIKQQILVMDQQTPAKEQIQSAAFFSFLSMWAKNDFYILKWLKKLKEE